MSSRSDLDSSRCTCISDDGDVVNYSEAEKILQEIKRDLQAVQNEIKSDMSKACPTERDCKVSSVLVKLQNADIRLHKIINIMQPQNDNDLSSNFGMSVKLDVARNKLSNLKEKHVKLRREWHSQEEHLNKIAEAVAKKEHELKFQSVFCTTQGFVLSKMLWKSSKCDCLLELMVTQEKLVLELIKTLDGCLYAFSRTYQNEMPEPTVDEYQYVLCLCGVLSNIASVPDGRFFLISQSICRDVYDQIIKMLPRILVPKAEGLKWIMLVAIHNVMICKEGREYAKSNRYLLQSLSKCIKPPHSNKIIILALKIIGNLTNDSSQSYIAHLSNILPLETLSQLNQSTDSCTIRKQTTEILNNVGTEKLLHTIQIEQSKSQCNAACTQTLPKKRNQELFAYYVFTDTTNTITSGYTTSTSGMSSSWDESNDRSDSVQTEFDESSESKFTQRIEASSAPIRPPSPPRHNFRSISAYNTGYLSPMGSSRAEDSNSYFARSYITQEPSSSLTARNVRSNRVPASTVTPIATFVDSLMFEAVSASTHPSPYKRIEDRSRTLSPMATYVDSTMLNQNADPRPRSPKRFEDNLAYGLAASTYVESRMLSIDPSSSWRDQNYQFIEPKVQTPYSCREFRASKATPISNYVNSAVFPCSSKQIKSNFPVNLKFNEKPSTLCHPSVWSIPAKPINTFQEPTPSRSQDLLHAQIPQMDLNKLLTISIGDNIHNPSANRRNAGNNTFADGQSNPSIVTVFRINNSKEYISADSSSSPFANTISTNTSFPWGLTVEDFFRIRNKNIGTSPKSSRRNVSLYLSEPKEAGKFACGGYESYYERLKKESCLSPKSNYEDVNMPSTSTGYYGYETLNPFAIYPATTRSSSTELESKKEIENSSAGIEQPGPSTSKGTLGKMPEMHKSQACSPVQSSWNCHVSKAKTKPKKKLFFRTHKFSRRRKF